MKPRIGHYFRMLHSATDQAMTNALASMDLTGAQGRIMFFISHSKQPPCARDIEEFFRLSHPTVSGLLSRLEKKGFVELQPDENDRRIKRIYLLPKGHDVLSAMRQTILSNDAQLVQDFSPEEIELFAQFLERAAANIGIGCCKRKPKEEQNQ